MLWSPALRRRKGRLRMVVRSARARAARDDVRSEAPTQAERTGAIRAGWNDAAWVQPRRVMPNWLTPYYKLGYAGGLVFRHRVELATRE